MKFTMILFLFTIFLSCHQWREKSVTNSQDETSQHMKTDTATFGTGCFWCSEAAFSELKGVISATSGYSGGSTKDPSYEEVCSGTTGHAEVVQVVYDPDSIPYAGLLEVFWTIHDPTSLNRQGADIGTQYRSVIFYHTEEQKRLAEEYKSRLDRSGAFDKPVVTQIVAFSHFYRAEEYHQEYFKKNPFQAYCLSVVRPKIEKFRKVFAGKLKAAK
jgi:peptide-methionine (S)-S-oxide reductase